MTQTSSTDHGSSACFLTPLANARTFWPTPSIAASTRAATGSGNRTRFGLRRSRKLASCTTAVFLEAVADADAARAGRGATTGASAPPASARDAKRRAVVCVGERFASDEASSASLDLGGR